MKNDLFLPVSKFPVFSVLTTEQEIVKKIYPFEHVEFQLHVIFPYFQVFSVSISNGNSNGAAGASKRK